MLLNTPDNDPWQWGISSFDVFDHMLFCASKNRPLTGLLACSYDLACQPGLVERHPRLQVGIVQAILAG